MGLSTASNIRSSHPRALVEPLEDRRLFNATVAAMGNAKTAPLASATVVSNAPAVIAPAAIGMKIAEVVLIDSPSDTSDGLMSDGMTVNLHTLGTKLNILANPVPESGVVSVRFTLDGKTYAVENVKPFCLAGDDNGDYRNWKPSVGQHTLVVTPYGARGGKGVAGTSTTVRFKVVSGEGVAPDQIHLSWTADPATSMTVVWHTLDKSAPHTVMYREAGNAEWLSTTGTARTSGTKGQLHQATMSGLRPDTAFEYRVAGADGNWSSTFTFRTADSAKNADFEFLYFADTGIVGRDDGLAKGTQQAIDEMTALHPDLVLGGGDYAYYNTDRRFGSIDNTIDAWFNQMQPLFANAPVMPTYGNHESYLDEKISDWTPRFAVTSGIEKNSSYSFNVGGIHFVSLLTGLRDSEGIPSARLNWLKNDLAAAKAAGYKWIIPYTHNAPFADGSSHPTNVPLRKQLAPLFEKYGVKIVLTSHDQSYERTLPLVNGAKTPTPTDKNLTGYDENDGVTWLKISPAGKLSSKGEDYSRFQHKTPQYPTAYRNDNMFHYSRVIVTAEGELKVQTYGFNGKGAPSTIIDQFTYTLGK